jgi:hypothetical protein
MIKDAYYFSIHVIALIKDKIVFYAHLNHGSNNLTIENATKNLYKSMKSF